MISHPTPRNIKQEIQGRHERADVAALNKYWEVALEATDAAVADKALTVLKEYYSRLPYMQQGEKLLYEAGRDRLREFCLKLGMPAYALGNALDDGEDLESALAASAEMAVDDVAGAVGDVGNGGQGEAAAAVEHRSEMPQPMTARELHLLLWRVRRCLRLLTVHLTVSRGCGISGLS